MTEKPIELDGANLDDWWNALRDLKLGQCRAVRESTGPHGANRRMEQDSRFKGFRASPAAYRKQGQMVDPSLFRICRPQAGPAREECA